jgi:peptidoglycan/xylan/chitin deacetylase (PgdA/CDA1 family)
MLIAIAMTQQWDIHIPAGICAVVGVFAADPAPRRRRSIARMAVVPVLAAVASLAAIGWVGSTSPAATWFGDRTSRGPTTGNRVALTFDDGPNAEATLQLAGILEQNNTRGTFFVTGEGATRHADVVKELVERGHTIGNHSETHDTWDFLSPWYPGLMRAQRSIAAASGVCPNVFRPPGGRHSPFMARIAEDHGLTVVTWDVDVGDLNRDDVRAMARDVVDRARAGSIIVLHDGPSGRDRSALVEALPRIIDGLKEAGLSPVPLNDLLGIPPSQPPEACKQGG